MNKKIKSNAKSTDPQLKLRRENSDLKKEISKLQQINSELLESEERYLKLIQLSPNPIVIHDGIKLLFINKAGMKLFGVKRKSEIIGKPIINFIHKEYKKIVEDRVSKMSTTKRAAKTIREKFLKKNGEVIEVEVTPMMVTFKGEPAIQVLISDLTEKHKKESELKESEEKYKILVENSHSGIGIANDNYKFIYANKRLCEMTGYNLKELIGSNFQKFLAKESIQLVADHYMRRQKGETVPSQYEFKIKNKNGEIRYVEISSSVIKDRYGNKRTHFQLLDINDNKKSETELIKANVKLAKINEEQNFLLNNLRDFIYRHDVNGNFEYVSPAVEQILGYTPEEMKRIETYFSDNPINENAIELTQKAIKTGKTFPPYRGELKHKNGNLINVEISEKPYFNDKGKIDGIAGIARDITERVEFEKVQNALYKISETSNQSVNLDSLFASIHEIILELMPAKNFYISLFDPQTNIVSFPYCVDEYSERPQSHILGMGLTDYIIKTGKSMIIDEKMDLELQKKGKVEMIGKRAKIWMGIVLRLTGKITGVMVVQDYYNPLAFGEKEKQILQFVSEQIALAIDRKIAQEQVEKYYNALANSRDELEESTSELTHLNKVLKKSEIELKELNASKDRFFSIIAHDLKNPFSSLLGISKMLTQDLRNMTMKELQESSDVMYSSAQNLYKLLENLLDWSRLQSGLLEIKPKNFNVRELVTHGIVLFSTSAEQKRISIKNNINKLHQVFADPEMIDTVIRNLISNSIKFTKPGGLIDITSAKKNGSIEIIVKDNGVGISTNIKRNLFKIDSKVSMPGTENEPGSGLGLMLCKDLVKINKGKISVKSKIGKGSEFIITLPKFKK